MALKKINTKKANKTGSRPVRSHVAPALYTPSLYATAPKLKSKKSRKTASLPKRKTSTTKSVWADAVAEKVWAEKVWAEKVKVCPSKYGGLNLKTRAQGPAKYSEGL